MAVSQKRLVAVKVRIKDLHDGKYVKEEGWNPNYIVTLDGRQVSRANIIGSVVTISSDDSIPSAVIDDGTERILVRSFEQQSDIIRKVSVGDIVLVIGRPREYGNEKYLVPEIMKRIDDNRWVEVRRLELKDMPASQSETVAQSAANFQVTATDAGEEDESSEDEVIVDDVVETKADDHASKNHTQPTDSDPTKLVCDMIRQLDKSDGADYEEVLARCGREKEGFLQMLLEQGEIFEIRPGKLKVLE